MSRNIYAFLARHIVQEKLAIFKQLANYLGFLASFIKVFFLKSAGINSCTILSQFQSSQAATYSVYVVDRETERCL